METDEASLTESLNLYREQLQQLEMALAAAPSDSVRAELQRLSADLKQLITLTEESLLSLKKSILLGMLEGQGASTSSSTNAPTTQSAANDMDAEFAAFQAAIAEDVAEKPDDAPAMVNRRHSSSSSSSGSDSDDDREPAHDEDDIQAELDGIAGAKCRCPYREEWGPVHYYNAMILAAEAFNSDQEPRVRVLFCNPTQESMLPCQYFLDGKCKFDDDTCRFSHGYSVSLGDLREYEEPDHSTLRLGSKCLAKYSSDGVWYPAVIVDVLEEHTFSVLFDHYENMETVSIEDIIPRDEHDEDSEDEGQSNQAELSDDDEDAEDDELPVYLWRPPDIKSTDSLGDWEQYTKGIGSKLMARMGYIHGEGLGKGGKGRVEPVPIQLLPQGKSLDKIMEMKERAGDRDLYDVMKKQKRKQRKVDEKAAVGYEKEKKKINVFEFINKKLGHERGDIHALVQRGGGSGASKQDRVHIKEADLKQRSDRHLNVQLLKTHEEIKGVNKEIARLKESIRRNDREKTFKGRVQKKIDELESYKNQLKTSEGTIQKHQATRKDFKKLTVF